MKCASCPLFTSWNNENDRGEACGLFGDGWCSPFQYEDKDGAIVGCYIDRHFIEKTDEEYQEHLLQVADSWERWMIKEESRPKYFIRGRVMIIDVMCSCCGNHKKLSNERIQDTADLIHSGWGSCGSALYCPECSKSWKARNGNRQMADERNTFILIMNLFYDAKGGE